MPSQTRIVIDQLEEFVEEVVREIGIEVTANLIETTPVDTGFARANWVPSVGTPFLGLAGSRENAEGGRVDSGLQTAGQLSITGYRLTHGSLYVTNNVEYIARLNDGSSTQAPSMFVEAAIQKAINEVAR